jgi:hypothetical protein
VASPETLGYTLVFVTYKVISTRKIVTIFQLHYATAILSLFEGINKKLRHLTSSCTVKIRGEIVLYFFSTEHNAMRAYWGCGGIEPRFISALYGLSGQLHAPAALHPEKEPPVPIG